MMTALVDVKNAKLIAYPVLTKLIIAKIALF